MKILGLIISIFGMLVIFDRPLPLTPEIGPYIRIILGLAFAILGIVLMIVKFTAKNVANKRKHEAVHS